MSKYWFEPKKYGWGFMPATTEGWLATLVLLTLLLVAMHTNKVLYGVVTPTNTLSFLFDTFMIATVFILVMQSKVKGGLKWRWNGHKTKRRKRRR